MHHPSSLSHSQLMVSESLFSILPRQVITRHHMLWGFLQSQ
nr:MAG TPA: hypothetical protein [Caudoviricetes sp.]